MCLARHKTLLISVALIGLCGVLPFGLAATEETPRRSSLPDEITDDPLLNSRFLLSSSVRKRRQALSWITKRGEPDMAAALIYMLRYWDTDQRGQLVKTLQRVTDHRSIGDDWFEWVLWQQARPEIVPFEGFSLFQSLLFASIDPAFRQFIYTNVPHEIRLEEILWGGVVKDGIPALNYPKFIDAIEADYLDDADQVFGVAINGDVRAYPYRIMDWHEMANDVVGGVPVALAYCTLCGSGILFRSDVESQPQPIVFGSSGFLYRSNKLMYDHTTHSLWNQFTGRPVVGKLTGSGIELEVLPLVTTSWRKWRERHPATKVLDVDTDFNRNYRPGAAYGRYFASSKLMFPVLVADESLKAKQEVFALRIIGAEKAWPLSAFENGRVINDRAGVIALVVIGDADTRTVRAYRSGGRTFQRAGDDLDQVSHEGELWRVDEDALRSSSGESLARLPGHLAYWFAWDNYLGDAELFQLRSEVP